MTDLKHLLTRYVEENTPTTPPEFSTVTASTSGSSLASGRRRGRTAVAVVASMAMVAALVILSALPHLLRDGQPSVAASGVPILPAPQSLLGTWVSSDITGFDESTKLPGADRAYITFNTDNTWIGSDGCNPLVGTYQWTGSATFTASGQAAFDMGCANVPNLNVVTEAASVSVTRGYAKFFDSSGTQLATYHRPYGATTPRAQLVAAASPSLALTTWGSSSCPARIASITAGTSNQLAVELVAPPHQACTLNFLPTTHTIALPTVGVDVHAPMTVTIPERGSYDITIPVDVQTLACPNRIPAYHALQHSTPGPLVPPGPSEGIVCRYSALTRNPKGKPVVEVPVPHPAQLAEELNSGRPVEPGFISCPVDNGVRYLVMFRYANAPTESVVVGLTGCAWAVAVTPPTAARWLTPDARNQLESASRRLKASS